jgi:hypothetical protein
MDAMVTEHLADWLVAEVFRLGTNLPPDEARLAINALVERRVPALYRDGSFRRILKPGLGPRAEIMMLLYAEPAGATLPELVEWSRLPRTTVSRHLVTLDRERLVRVDKSQRPQRYSLLPPGERHIESEGWLAPT